MKVLVIGGGNIGLTFAERMASSPLLQQEKIRINDISTDLLRQLANDERFITYKNLEDCLPEADIVFLAVKPQHSAELMHNMKAFVNDKQLFISLMAGITIPFIESNLGVQKIVRIMPNLPAKIGKGVTSYTESSAVTQEELAIAKELLATTGKTVYVTNEKFIDKTTGISGSGPAYIFYFINSMLETTKKMGFSDEDARTLVISTFEGSVQLFAESDISAQEWIDKVATKGGTTRVAIDYMDNNNVSTLIEEAIFAAFNRSEELGKK